MFEAHHRVTLEKEKMQTHYHNMYEIIFVVSGEALFTINGRQYRAGKGSLLFISNHETHRLGVEATPYERYWALISREFFNSAVPDPLLSSVFRNRPADFSHMATIPEEDAPAVRSLFEDMLAEYTLRREYWQDAVQGCLRLLFVRLCRSMRGFFPLKELNRTTQAILAIQKTLEERCGEDYTLSDAARQSFIEMHYLSRLFREVTGFTFQQYRILQRISLAKGLLKQTQDSVAKIGETAGFGNASHFIRIFKKTVGLTPNQYRKTAER